MIELPRHLAPWAPQLALFSPEMALALGATVSRLASLLGGWQLASADQGQPDGYDGIARRGSYERLLPAEWLMLDEIPEEFLRRVVSGEHSFLRRAHSQHASGRRCIALFDSGIEQLGAPRIAHLALLIALARRAEELRATFDWGTFQDDEPRLRTGASEASVQGLLRARSNRCVSAGDVERWTTFLGSSPASEIWFIGAETTATFAAKHRASAIVISDVIEPELPQRVRVRVSPSRAARVKEAVLEVPPERLAVRLLRDPFATAVAPRVVANAELDPQSTMVFSPDGRRLYVRSTDWRLVCFQVPNSPRAAPQAPVIFAAPGGRHVLAVGRSAAKKRTVTLTWGGSSELFLDVLSKRGATAMVSERFEPVEGYSLPTDFTGLLRPLGVLEQDRACWLHVRGQLMQLANGQFSPMDHGFAIAAQAFRDCLALARVLHDVPRITWIRTGKSGNLELRETNLPADLPRLYGATNFYFGAGASELFAYATSPTSCAIVHQRECRLRAVPSGLRVVGVVGRGHGPREVGLIALEESKTRFMLILEARTETLFTTTAPVTNVEVSGTGGQIAYLTRSGELGIYSVEAKAVVLRSTGQDAT